MFKNLLRTSCHWKFYLSNFNLKFEASWDAILCCGVKNANIQRQYDSLEHLKLL